MATEKKREFLKLCEEAANCMACPALADKAAVLSELNGCLGPRAMFIAEAPGRQGADRTRRPFHGDRSGDNFQKFLDSVGLRREDIFITNSVLCSPRKASGANRSPSASEKRNCSYFLKKQIELIDPRVLVTLGSVALEALKAIEYHEYSLGKDAARVLEWRRLKLIPLFHPSPQVIISRRSFEQQLADFQVLASLI